MPELFIELFSEEIPSRLQARGAEELRRLVSEELAAITPAALRPVSGPRRIALAAEVAASVVSVSTVERGPRVTAPEQALAGFLRKHAASRDALRDEGGFWVLDRASAAVDAALLIAGVMPGLLRRFVWPKSMRWGGTSAFTWIRPLRRIVCLLDGRVVPFALAAEGDDGHGLASGGLTEGHRFHSPGPVAVGGVRWLAGGYARALRRAGRGGAGGPDRRRHRKAGAGARLVGGGRSWPGRGGCRIGRVAGAAARPHRRGVHGSATRGYAGVDAGEPALFCAAWLRWTCCTVVGSRSRPTSKRRMVERPSWQANERVLRARFSDARHFWDLDRRTRLADRVAALDGVTFQAELGSQGDRTRRLVRLAGVVAPLVGADKALAERAALLAKADLTTGMVGEFPELQGVMGGYYAQHDGEDARVAVAVREHYAPKGAGDSVPSAPVSVALALADKLDQLAAFFSIGQKPTGSGDPYALRRAAIGVIRIMRENGVRVALRPVLVHAANGLTVAPAMLADDVLAFIVERLRVQMRGEGARHDVLSAVFATSGDDDLIRALARRRRGRVSVEHGRWRELAQCLQACLEHLADRGEAGRTAWRRCAGGPLARAGGAGVARSAAARRGRRRASCERRLFRGDDFAFAITAATRRVFQ